MYVSKCSNCTLWYLCGLYGIKCLYSWQSSQFVLMKSCIRSLFVYMLHKTDRVSVHYRFTQLQLSGLFRIFFEILFLFTCGCCCSLLNSLLPGVQKLAFFCVILLTSPCLNSFDILCSHFLCTVYSYHIVCVSFPYNVLGIITAVNCTCLCMLTNT